MNEYRYKKGSLALPFFISLLAKFLRWMNAVVSLLVVSIKALII
ncbi:hypothetical protein SAMN06265379_101832 [Saccharicrinis carchari]|uniref:Uncharacterized protein n=1 Tax=Saccharicrinis carchari TaxID=1168039 RepID=A0A521BAM3_SACCC|nr:hypothetical protein SAMN06265379_101832 [Saccharicrinis carchari]